MRMGFFAALALVGAVACGTDKNDTGGTGTTGTTTTTTGDTVDSCDWSLGVCYEFTNFSGTADFCDQLAAAYGGTATYAADGCPSGSVFECSLPGVSIYGGGPAVNEPASAYYYSDFTNDPATACSDAGGTPE